MRPTTRRVTAQRKFAQGAYIPPVVAAAAAQSVTGVSVNTANGTAAAPAERRDVPPGNPERNNVFHNHMPIKQLLDMVCFTNSHNHLQPIVLVERLPGRNLNGNETSSAVPRIVKRTEPKEPKPKLRICGGVTKSRSHIMNLRSRNQRHAVKKLSPSPVNVTKRKSKGRVVKPTPRIKNVPKTRPRFIRTELLVPTASAVSDFSAEDYRPLTYFATSSTPRTSTDPALLASDSMPLLVPRPHMTVHNPNAAAEIKEYKSFLQQQSKVAPPARSPSPSPSLARLKRIEKEIRETQLLEEAKSNAQAEAHAAITRYMNELKPGPSIRLKPPQRRRSIFTGSEFISCRTPSISDIFKESVLPKRAKKNSESGSVASYYCEKNIDRWIDGSTSGLESLRTPTKLGLTKPMPTPSPVSGDMDVYEIEGLPETPSVSEAPVQSPSIDKKIPRVKSTGQSNDKYVVLEWDEANNCPAAKWITNKAVLDLTKDQLDARCKKCKPCAKIEKLFKAGGVDCPKLQQPVTVTNKPSTSALVDDLTKDHESVKSSKTNMEKNSKLVISDGKQLYLEAVPRHRHFIIKLKCHVVQGKQTFSACFVPRSEANISDDVVLSEFSYLLDQLNETLSLNVNETPVSDIPQPTSIPTVSQAPIKTTIQLTPPQPASVRPELSQSERTQPDASQSEPSQLKPSQPNLSQPFPSKSEPSQTAPSQPNPSQPDPSQPDPSQPDPSQPDPSQPDLSQPEQSQPQLSEPEPSQLYPSQTDLSQPQSSQSEPKQPEPSLPETSYLDPTQFKLLHPESSQLELFHPKSSQSDLSQIESTQLEPSQFKPTHCGPSRPEPARSEPSQPSGRESGSGWAGSTAHTEPDFVKVKGVDDDEESRAGHIGPRTKRKVLEAPTFWPTKEEFSDPMAYLEKISKEAAKYGICKIVPPEGFAPPCKADDDARFEVSNQYISRLYHRWGSAAREFCAIKACLRTQNINHNRLPMLEGVEVNLPKLYHLVQHHGGLETVLNKKRWGRVADDMNLPKNPFIERKLDQIYSKYLLPYATLSTLERATYLDRVEKSWNKKHKKMLQRAKNPLNRQNVLLGEPGTASADEIDEDETDDVEDCVKPGSSMNLAKFKKVARSAFTNFFGERPVHCREVEHEYWRLMVFGSEHVCVNSASIDTAADGHGFSTSRSDMYSKHPWNLKNMSQHPANVLRALGPVLGLTVPTLHLGMVFSTSCWHRDPHGLPWIEYQHTGPTNIWYGIPEDQDPMFRNAVEVLCPTSCQNKKLWLPSDITMIPPYSLLEHNVKMYRVEQLPGEFVLVMPRAYSCSINTGFTISESVYFATESWLDKLPNVFADIRDSCEPTMFALEQILKALVEDPRTTQSILAKIYPTVNYLFTEEISLRLRLQGEGVKKVRHKNEEPQPSTSKGKRAKPPTPAPTPVWNVRDQDECEICRCTLYLSKVKNLPSSNSMVCLPHAIKLLEMPSNAEHIRDAELILEYSNSEVQEVVYTVRQRLEID